MRILFDQGAPVPLRRVLVARDVETTWQRGWSELSNGDLLAAAEAARVVAIANGETIRGDIQSSPLLPDREYCPFQRRLRVAQYRGQRMSGEHTILRTLVRVCTRDAGVQLARFTALSTALIDASSMFVSIAAPQRVRPSANLIWI